jgi:hypothetical protein
MESDQRYLEIIRDAVSVCRRYSPKFGQGGKGGLSLDEFKQLYESDPFYSWFGLDSPLVYAAHKAAGGITSVYRQIGMAAERVFRAVLQDTLGQTEDESSWSYSVPTTTGKSRKLSLDGRISVDTIRNAKRKPVVKKWIANVAKKVSLPPRSAKGNKGVVFECRQGYKSKDSKRQNADIANASNAYANNYIPCVMLFSLQIDSDVAERYVRAQWLLLTGTLNGTPLESTYVFCREVLGYDLAAFFRRNRETIKSQIEDVFKGLLSE